MDRNLLTFCFSLIFSLSLQAQVPSPKEVIGFQMGADYEIADYTQITDYLEKLDEASERVQMQQIGTSVLGRPLYVLFISSKENLRQLDKWKEISAKLARARIPDDEAQQLAQEGKAIIWIDGGIHSTERAATQFPPELAYMVATEETAEMKKIRENVIFMLMPNINPDGLDIVADWYKRNLDTPYETSYPPVLYHYYVGHDDNRDWFMNTQPETRAVTNLLFNEWYPQIVHNQHQSSPRWARIFIPPFSKPVNPHIHAGVVNGVNLVGNEMATRFAVNNMPGVISDVTYTMWWNGGLRTTPYFHNQVGILTETAHTTPTPRFYPPDSLPKTIANGVPTDGTAINYPSPWKGGESRFRDAVAYMLTAGMATLSIGADRKEKWLYDMYRMGRDAIEAESDAFAYVIPTEQWNASEARNLVNILMQGGLEVHQADQSFSVGDTTYAEGSFVLYGAQAFRPYLKDLLEKQEYPDIRLYPGGPPKTPYDLAGWTLPLQMGVRVDRLDSEVKIRATAVTKAVRPTSGKTAESANFAYALSPRDNASAQAINYLLAEQAKVHWLGEATDNLNAGTLLIERDENTELQLTQLADSLGLTFTGINNKPEATLHQIRQPKVGLYKSWVANMDEGWTRWLLDEYNFQYDTLHDEQIRTADLAQYDAIIIPDQSPQRILHGHAIYNMPKEYTGGLGLAGTLALQDYVKQGGTLIAFDKASDFAIQQFGLPVKNVVSGLSSKEFFIPGSLIRASVDTAHPLAYGMQDTVATSFSRSRAFEIVKQEREGEGGQEDITKLPDPTVETIVRYAQDDLLMSGWALGEKKHIGGKSAMMRVKHGEGSIVLFGFRPQFRGQPRGTYKLIFNAIYSSTVDDLPVLVKTEDEEKAE
ncbi:M14 family zinc carboxypeptidase [Tunicatimonas pelagia]|uniref:M14 family zinc carboxypeptidase n=1 Tax=Tunicatimonas pelagia TaxID=931531 RepID=UPI002666D698|nr:M14 family zinc carboxypeptidase [Tunicatimonas pelagia]WKN45593.1 M14 family zinc carboxypeptidase [Tunicatimonas pelagia]